MRVLSLFIVLTLLYSSSKAQGHQFNIACTDFTFQERKNEEATNVRKNFEAALPKFKKIFRVIEREDLSVFFQQRQVEKNLFHDFNEIVAAPQLAGVDYIVIGDITLNSSLDKYRININFIKIRGTDVTSKLPLAFTVPKAQFTDDEEMKSRFQKELTDFTEYFTDDNNKNGPKSNSNSNPYRPAPPQSNDNKIANPIIVNTPQSSSVYNGNANGLHDYYGLDINLGGSKVPYTIGSPAILRYFKFGGSKHKGMFAITTDGLYYTGSDPVVINQNCIFYKIHAVHGSGWSNEIKPCPGRFFKLYARLSVYPCDGEILYKIGAGGTEKADEYFFKP